MQFVHNPMTGTVKYVTKTWARWLKSYGWRDATFEQYMAWEMCQYALYPVETNTKGTFVSGLPGERHHVEL